MNFSANVAARRSGALRPTVTVALALTALAVPLAVARNWPSRSAASGLRLAAAPVTPTVDGQATIAQLPRLLSETGLYLPGTTEVDPRNVAIVPQYSLWTDGATKRRYLRLPDGESIDGSNPDAWQFPRGTRLWKELSFGRRVETRFIERLPDGSYRYATYVWSEGATDATLSPEQGLAGFVTLPGGSAHDIPARSDCLSCHEGRPSPVLGVNALQLSDDRDPRALHREREPAQPVGLSELVRRGLLRGLPASLLEAPPRIRSTDPTARAAEGYLFANCAGCHNADGPLRGLGLDFDQSVGNDARERVRATTFGRESRFRTAGAVLRVAPGRPEQSSVLLRLRSRDPVARMPPLGTHVVDAEAVRLIERWITAGT